MSDLDVAMNTYEAVYHFTTEDNSDGYWVAVSKVGGGTVGREYCGRWYASVMSAEGWRLNCYNSDGELDTVHREMSHTKAAETALDFYILYNS